jgi:hypothetical protein
VIGRGGRVVLAKHANGSVIPVSLEVDEVILEGQRYFVGCVVPKDATKKKKTTLLQRTCNVVDQLAVASVVIAPSGVVHAFNTAAQLFGYEVVLMCLFGIAIDVWVIVVGCSDEERGDADERQRRFHAQLLFSPPHDSRRKQSRWQNACSAVQAQERQDVRGNAVHPSLSTQTTQLSSCSPARSLPQKKAEQIFL